MPWGDNHTETGQRYNKHVFINVILYIAWSSSRVLVAVSRQMTNIFIYFKTGFNIRARFYGSSVLFGNLVVGT